MIALVPAVFSSREVPNRNSPFRHRLQALNPDGESRGASVCKGNRIAMPHLDSIIIEAVEDRILPPERIHILLEKLIARRTSFTGNIDARLASLRSGRTKVEAAISNRYRLAETDGLGIDESLSARIQELRAQKTKIDATITRAEAQAAPVAQLHAENVEAFPECSRRSFATQIRSFAAITCGAWSGPFRRTVFVILYRNGAPVRIEVRTPIPLKSTGDFATQIDHRT